MGVYVLTVHGDQRKDAPTDWGVMWNWTVWPFYLLKLRWQCVHSMTEARHRWCPPSLRWRSFVHYRLLHSGRADPDAKLTLDWVTELKQLVCYRKEKKRRGFKIKGVPTKMFNQYFVDGQQFLLGEETCSIVSPPPIPSVKSQGSQESLENPPMRSQWSGSGSQQPHREQLGFGAEAQFLYQTISTFLERYVCLHIQIATNDTYISTRLCFEIT